MKVLFISSGNSSFGISPIILNQGKSLEEQGISVSYFPIKGKGIKGYFNNIRLIRRYLKHNRFDIVHAHYSLSAIVTSFAGANPLVVSLMGSDVKASHLYKYILWFFKYFYWDSVIVKSDDMIKSLKFKRLNLIPNGVNLDLFYPMNKEKCREMLKWEIGKTHILFPSDPKRPEKNYALLKESIHYYLEDYNIETHFLTNIPHKQVPYILNASDVVVLTSLWEGSPNAVKEAMACNRPIVTTDVGDVKWLLSGLNGCYIVNSTPKDLGESIIKALQFSKYYNETHGRDQLMKLELSSETIAKKLISIYKKLVNK